MQLHEAWICYMIELIKADGIIHKDELHWLRTFTENITKIPLEELDIIVQERLKATCSAEELNQLLETIKKSDPTESIMLLSYALEVMRADNVEAEEERTLVSKLAGTLFGQENTQLFMDWIESDLRTKALWSQVAIVIANLDSNR